MEMDESLDNNENDDGQKKAEHSLSPDQLIEKEMSKYYVMQTTTRILRFL